MSFESDLRVLEENRPCFVADYGRSGAILNFKNERANDAAQASIREYQRIKLRTVMAEHESIWRKVIAGVFTAGIIAVLGWFLPGLLTVVAKFLLTIWRRCIHLVGVPAWLLTLLLLYVGTSLIRAYLRHRSRIRQKSQPSDDSPDEPDWRDYTCNVFHEIVWRWSYASRGRLFHLLPFCFKCDTQIHPKIGSIGPLGEKTDYTCDHCGNQVLLDGSHEQVLDWISRQIQRKLRSPSKEWKTAIKTHGWRNK